MELLPTDLYIRWMPKDSVQMKYMRSIHDVLFFDYPLDKMLTDEELEVYRDSVRGVYYSVVPVDRELPDSVDLRYEILDELFIQRGKLSKSRQQLTPEIYEQVCMRALALTGNLDYTRSLASATWMPSARIYYQEDEPYLKSRNMITPLKGVAVYVNDYVNVAVGYTDARGETGAIGSFTGPVRYSIHWQDEHWTMSEFVTGEGYTLLTSIGPEQREKWSHMIVADTPHSSKEMVAAGAHRALYEYYYGNYAQVSGLTKYLPEEPVDVVFRFWASDAAGRYYNDTIDLYPVWSADNYYPKYYVTMHTFHELGHGIQEAINGEKLHIDSDVSESWARFVEYLYMNTVYPGYAGRHYFPGGICVSKESAEYSFIGPSLMYNGFTPAQIEQSVRSVTTWEEWKAAVKSMGLLDEKRVNQLFEYPNTFLCDINNLITGPDVVVIHEPTTFRLPQRPMYYAVKALEWTNEGTGGTIHNQYERQAVFSFDTSGTKIIKARLQFPDGTIETQSRTIAVPDDVIQTSAIAPFAPETTYRIYYYVPEDAENITLVFNRYGLLPYIEIPMEHHPEEQSFSFRFPDGFPIDYVAWLSYRRYGVEHMTPALFSNYRETMN